MDEESTVVRGRVGRRSVSGLIVIISVVGGQWVTKCYRSNPYTRPGVTRLEKRHGRLTGAQMHVRNFAIFAYKT